MDDQFTNFESQNLNQIPDIDEEQVNKEILPKIK